MTRNRDKPAWRCSDEMRLAAYVGGKLNTGDRAKVEHHLARCSFCLGQVTALGRLQNTELPEVPPALLERARNLVSPKGRASAPAWRWAVASALTASTAIVLTVWVKSPQVAAPEAVRTGSAYRSNPLLLVPHEGMMFTRQAIEFRWTPVDRALFYEVRVLTADGDLVWEARADEARVRPPADLQFHADQRYFVSVSASIADGKAVKSRMVGFGVAEP